MSIVQERQAVANWFSRRRLAIFALILLTAPDIAAAQQLQEVTIGMPSSSLATAFPRLTKEMGLFAKHGLDVKFVYLDNASIATTALVSGSVKLTISGPGELIAAQAQGHKVITIATAYGGLAATLVLSKSVVEKLGISPTASLQQRLKALDGLLLAGSSATSAATIVTKGAAAKIGGASPRFVYINQQAMAAALETGAIHGYVSSAPYWIIPVSKGTGVAWISGPSGEIPAEFAPVSASVLQTTRDFANANPDLVKKIQAAFADFSKAVEERPADVKESIRKTFSDLDAKTIDLFFAAEAGAWKVKPMTAAGMAQEISFMKASGVNLPQWDKLDPGAMVYP